MEKKIEYAIFLLLTVLLFAISQPAFAGQFEKKGIFRVDGDNVIVNEREIVRLHKDTQIVNAIGNALSRASLKDARVVIVLTDDATGIVTKIIVTGWHD
jgi:hypothetical protein